MADSRGSETTVIILIVCLIGLILLLVLLYKKLNKEANGEYTIRHLTYKEGGLRDRVRGVALALETRLGVQLWPRSDSGEEGGEEMHELQDEDRDIERGTSQGSDSEEDAQEEEEERAGERDDDDDDDSDDNLSSEGSDAGENARLTCQQTAKEELVEGKEENVGNIECKGEASGGAGMLIDLKQFSGSVTWSDGGVCRDTDVTAL